MAARLAPVAVTAIPEWTYKGKPPSIYTFAEAIALSGLEGQAIRLDAATQRALLGFPVFGRRSLVLLPSGEIESTVSVCFGTDSETAKYSAATVKRAALAQKELRPGSSGPRFLNGC